LSSSSWDWEQKKRDRKTDSLFKTETFKTETYKLDT